MGCGLLVAELADHAVLLKAAPADGPGVGMLVPMLALVTSGKVILAITGGIPTLLALIAFGAVLTRPKR